ncbi:Zinc finger, DNA-directed DNA polymerase, family B, alpha [Kalmanozyma brasiliensis GHG001]|uniref:DNA polymerase n=1 Tax=Kalmanozyma brasiliensis (strain GHG001) TaxID=1365824 RepID=V5F0L6_KALBG|nr:Zinc finger, DNA-directed DNA polymerase, family B, alpha [Kalmanozyma brasiliensis GHG001]EST08774.1 Zinc finger, DNA-directed DNA polymerase, family B, alpha [Kalmanozyma brasiliensis GHG001]
MSSRAKKLNALAALKAKRDGAPMPSTSKSGNYSDEDDAIYDEVSEDEYRSILRGRVMDDDFIEDDDGSGYVDHGQDEWDDRTGAGHDEDDDTEDEQEYFERTGKRKPKKGSKAGAKGASSASKKSSLTAAFSKQRKASSGADLSANRAREAQRMRSAALDAYRPTVSKEKEEDFMTSLMGDLDEFGAQPSTSSHDPASPSPAHRLSTSLSKKRKQHEESAFSRFRPSTSASASNGFTSPSSGAPTSDSAQPSSDSVEPRVHVSGSDTPPWGPNLGSDPVFELDDEPLTSNKKLRGPKGLPSRIGSLGLGDADNDVFISHPSKRAAGLSNDALAFSDDEADDLAVRRVEVGSLPAKTVDARGQASRPKPVTVETPRASKVDDIKKDIKTPSAFSSSATPKTSLKDESKTPASRSSWQKVHNDLIKNVEQATPTPAAGSNIKTAPGNATPSAGKVAAFEEDKSLFFYWLDYLEGENGVVYLVGKVKDKETGRYVSCCLTVNGIERCIFLLPRSKQLEDGHETDRAVGEDEIYDEFEDLSAKHGIKRFLSKWVTRKYAFEQAGVPAESDYMKIRYGFDEPQLPFDFKGRTFSKTFGTNTSPFELLVVKRRIFGPSWLKISNASVTEGSTPISWCKMEVSIDDPKDISPISDVDTTSPRETPPLTVMSIATRTVVNHKENKQELVAVSARTWTDHQIEDPTPPEQLPCSVFTAVRPLGSMFPPGFEAEARKSKIKIHTLKYERMLLNALLAQIHNADPDVIVGHEFNGVSLDVLLHRMKDLRADHWSRVGRFRRPKWPKLKQGMNLKILAGRLVCDLASDNGKSMITSTTWSLTEMCGTHLKIQREDIDPEETASFFDSLAPSPERLMTFVRHCEVDTFFQMAIAAKVQILPLTKQLTNLAGNSWNKTLNGGRAERNEYILLHDFHRQKYVCPDKISAWEKKQIQQAAELKAKAKAKAGGAAAVATAVVNSKKDKFKGGLVFEPKRGLWDKYILVMDFNSLYPSIIQEFNIDFTTVERPPTQGLEDEEVAAAASSAASAGVEGETAGDAAADVDKIPEVPSSDVDQGVLPRIIAQLVARRRQVKSLMKDKTATPSQLMQWNIKQLALKLTANSMYGCLGFENSRFYARPLAALTTFKGREILTATKDLAESMLLDVIYGDTDSVMINTNATEYREALRIGQEFKKSVNERYRLLEIDIDGVFERMLLLQKKKYAAVLVDEDGKRTTEIKGLDMKRREYSALSKNVSNYVLDQILSGQATELVVEHIHEYLSQMSTRIKTGEVAMDDFIIYKRLGKNPEDYPDVKSQPHVQVALRMKARGGSARMGDVIPYIFCLGEDGSSSTKTAQAERAHHPDELRRKESELKIDYEHYLALQILPPVERLCESIEGTDRSRLAECLGLDPSKYSNVSISHAGAGADREFATLDSQIPDEVRFARCAPLTLTCPSCRETSTFLGPAHRTPTAAIKPLGDSTNVPVEERNAITTKGIRCTNPACQRMLPLATVAIQLELAIRSYVERYYAGWTECSDANCGSRTRMASVYAKRCLAIHDAKSAALLDATSSTGGAHLACRGRVEPSYRDKQLYDQLIYLESLFDAGRIRDKVTGAGAAVTASGKAWQDEVVAVLDVNRRELEALHKTVDRYLAKNGRRFVKLGSLFRFMKV